MIATEKSCNHYESIAIHTCIMVNVIWLTRNAATGHSTLSSSYSVFLVHYEETPGLQSTDQKNIDPARIRTPVTWLKATPTPIVIYPTHHNFFFFFTWREGRYRSFIHLSLFKYEPIKIKISIIIIYYYFIYFFFK